jgi:hypothetical protein
MTDARSVEAITADHFRALGNGRFKLTGTSPQDGSAVSIEVELAEVTGPGDSRAGGFRAPFSVEFHGPLSPVLPQCIYRLENERLGPLELFIVPLGPDSPAAPTLMRYEAVFG